ncbi:short chain enoyl-CoA hydratase [Paraburkholderia sp. BL6669N2]|uniref:enoyl-CoA hydratase-related protein n=1 Tax=Paraburkholderia sp. BL6669N2 TaxID=1938807 RepID=UPI000E225C73|nr:enoyl-CoA hydratase-related protein [Paraburkholderia sp. BL6669N2]REG52115.1 short chain enoyl-CoA hydratase [Paraburkholderia sp. BL6669N2]
MSALQNLLYEKKAGIAYVTLNRPKALNALSRATLDELRSVMEDARDDAAVRGVIVTGAGDKAFVAGADITEIASVSAIEAQAFTRSGQFTFDLIEHLGKPVIAAVNGFALGGGCELAMACTLRLATVHAKFGQPEVKLGVIPGFGGTQRLPRLVGKGRALQLILTADTIDAAEAHRIGLVNEIVEADQLVARAEAILNRIAANAPIATRLTLEAVNYGLDMTLAQGLVLESGLFAVCASTADKREGTAAFIGKRAPNFTGN